VIDPPHFRSCAAVPLLEKGGHRIGILGVIGFAPQKFSGEMASLLCNLGDMAMKEASCSPFPLAGVCMENIRCSLPNFKLQPCMTDFQSTNIETPLIKALYKLDPPPPPSPTLPHPTPSCPPWTIGGMYSQFCNVHLLAPQHLGSKKKRNVNFGHNPCCVTEDPLDPLSEDRLLFLQINLLSEHYLSLKRDIGSTQDPIMGCETFNAYMESSKDCILLLDMSQPGWQILLSNQKWIQATGNIDTFTDQISDSEAARVSDIACTAFVSAPSTAGDVEVWCDVVKNVVSSFGAIRSAGCAAGVGLYSENSSSFWEWFQLATSRSLVTPKTLAPPTH